MAGGAREASSAAALATAQENRLPQPGEGPQPRIAAAAANAKRSKLALFRLFTSRKLVKSSVLVAAARFGSGRQNGRPQPGARFIPSMAVLCQLMTLTDQVRPVNFEVAKGLRGSHYNARALKGLQ